MLAPNNATVIYLEMSYHKEIKVLGTLVHYLERHLAWPTELDKKNRRHHFYFFKLCVVFSCLGFIVAGCALHMYATHGKAPNIDLSEDWSILVSVSVIMVVWLTFLWNQKEVFRTLDKLNLIHNYETPMHLEEMEQRLSLMFRILYRSIIIAICSYAGLAISDSYRCQKHEDEVHKICGLMCPLWLPFDVDFFGVKQLIFLIQFLGALIGITGAALASMYGFAHNIHIVLCLRHLKRMTRFIYLGASFNETKFRRFIQYHQNIFRLVSVVNKAGSLPMCTHLLLTSTVLGVFAHRILDSTVKTAAGVMMYMVLWMTSLFLNSLGGQLLLDESISVATDVYRNVKWYLMDIKTRRDILFVITRCQKPFLVKTGSFGYMSFSVLLTVAKGLYYFTLLDIWTRFMKDLNR